MSNEGPAKPRSVQALETWNPVKMNKLRKQGWRSNAEILAVFTKAGKATHTGPQMRAIAEEAMRAVSPEGAVAFESPRSAWRAMEPVLMSSPERIGRIYARMREIINASPVRLSDNAREAILAIIIGSAEG